MWWTAFLIFLWTVLYGYVRATSNCGKVLVPEFQGTDAKIVYQPPTALADRFRNKYGLDPGFRFIFRTNVETQYVIIQLSDDRYRLNEFTLLIPNVSQRDDRQGHYQVECFDHPIRNRTNSVLLATQLPTTAPTKTTFSTILSDTVSQDVSSGGLSHRDIAMIVVALCAVLIVLIVMLSLVAIFRYKRRTTDGGTTLVSKNDPSFGNANEISDIYNEIGPEECQPEASRPESSPMLSRDRVHNAPRGTVKIRNEYAQINEAQMLSESELVTIKGDNCASENGDPHYNVAFPSINCETLTKHLYQNSDFARDNLYAKPLKKSERRKSRMKSVELKYITMDLSHGEEDDHHDDAPSIDISNLTLEYAEIDFEKSNFKAPLRKAPSSWYLRKNRKKR